MCYDDITCHTRLLRLHVNCHARLLYLHDNMHQYVNTHEKWARIALMSPRMRASTGTPDTQIQSNLIAGPKQLMIRRRLIHMNHVGSSL